MFFASPVWPYKTLFAGLCLVMLYACSKKDSLVIPCTNYSITTSTNPSDPCLPQGSIRIISPIQTGMQYRVGNGSFQSSPDFPSLTAGQYTVAVKDDKGCMATATVSIPAVAPGTLFGVVKSLLAGNCLSCHSGVNPQAGLDFTDNCTIVNNWDRIKERAVNGNPSPMPQAGLLPLSERNKITAWITAGHRFTD
jgi:hypothetical protein